MKSRRSIIAGFVFSTVMLVSNCAWADTLVIKGSTTIMPIAKKIAESFMEKNPGIQVSVSGEGSEAGLKALIDGDTTIASASRFITQEEVQQAVENGRYPVPFSIAYDSIIPIVHPRNKVGDLTLEQLKAIYRGEIKNWKELGGSNAPITVVSRETSSGTYQVWEKIVMNNERVFSGALRQSSNAAVFQVVSKTKSAIGYIGLGYLRFNVSPVKVNGIFGSTSTTLNRTYPISRPLYMFTVGWPTGATSRFIKFAVHPEKGQKIVENTGFIPLY